MGGAVLVVEDDPSVAVVLRRVLGRLGATVESVGTGAEVMTRIATGRFDLVVLDLGLPDVDGLDVCRDALASGYAGQILVLSARYGNDVPARALAAGAHVFMSKPFTLSEIQTRAGDLLAGRVGASGDIGAGCPRQESNLRPFA